MQVKPGNVKSGHTSEEIEYSTSAKRKLVLPACTRVNSFEGAILTIERDFKAKSGKLFIRLFTGAVSIMHITKILYTE